MGSRENITIPSNVAGIGEVYHRNSRFITLVLAVCLVVLPSAVFIFPRPLIQWPVLFAILILVGRVLLRSPIYHRDVHIELETDKDVESVFDEFSGPLSPALTFTWAIAQSIDCEGESVEYEIPGQLGISSGSIKASSTDSLCEDEKSQNLRIDLTSDGHPIWENNIQIKSGETKTNIQIDSVSKRRFGLIRLPQFLLTDRYFDQAMEAQGYDVIGRTTRLKISNN